MNLSKLNKTQLVAMVEQLTTEINTFKTTISELTEAKQVRGATTPEVANGGFRFVSKTRNTSQKVVVSGRYDKHTNTIINPVMERCTVGVRVQATTSKLYYTLSEGVYSKFKQLGVI
jgi:hypothetical protein